MVRLSRARRLPVLFKRTANPCASVLPTRRVSRNDARIGWRKYWSTHITHAARWSQDSIKEKSSCRSARQGRKHKAIEYKSGRRRRQYKHYVEYVRDRAKLMKLRVTDGILELYTDESPGLKVDPFVVMTLSIGFIASVVMLHSMSSI